MNESDDIAESLDEAREMFADGGMPIGMADQMVAAVRTTAELVEREPVKAGGLLVLDQIAAMNCKILTADGRDVSAVIRGLWAKADIDTVDA